MSTSFLLAVALVAQGGPATERWIEIGRDSKQIEYVDSQSVNHEGRRLIWTRIDFSTPQSDGAWSALYGIEINCAKRTYALLVFLSRDNDGRTISQSIVPNPVWERITPHTGSETVFGIACSRGTP